jgi:hypothetical protein
MDREELIKLSREAGVHHINLDDDYIFALERFAALVAAAEREACAKVCDARYMGDNNREDMEARRCAAAIRARGEQ